LNREIKRRLKREQESKEKMGPMRPVPAGQRRERVKTRQFIREVQGELRRVIWPTRNEVITYSVVVVVIVVILALIVFAMDLGFAKGVFQLFKPASPSAPPILPPVSSPLPSVVPGSPIPSG
jgi:preprotein translocase subunit SecE